MIVERSSHWPHFGARMGCSDGAVGHTAGLCCLHYIRHVPCHFEPGAPISIVAPGRSDNEPLSGLRKGVLKIAKNY
ncbi:hypothetical protein M408DRAFT_136247 [Serendipita vermifera MAFF 305830]|uniref:Uncharacterized protein n=1 Tax=Serendipita vermifera MAFF 305830 TaxID=933852 RepID=A0A0C2XHG7_SERVB|nr:hypothetical protein M408DRAFT_136247 [Serendipita vermifera MAFF 305830]